MTKPFILDKKSKKELNERIKAELGKSTLTRRFMKEMISGILNKPAITIAREEDLFPSDGGRAGLVFKELLKLNEVAHLPGYAYFAYDQSFLHFLPDFQVDVIEKPLDN